MPVLPGSGEIVQPATGEPKPGGPGFPAPTGDPMTDAIIYMAAGGGALGAAARFLPGYLAKLQLHMAWKKHQKAVAKAQKYGTEPPTWTPPPAV